MISGINSHHDQPSEYSAIASTGDIGARDSHVPKSRDKAAELTDSQVTISKEAQEHLKNEDDNGSGINREKDLSEEEKRIVQQLKRVDAETKAHEKAHIAAGAGLVQGGASFTYKRGPDGHMYAVGGEVSIDTSAENDPDATIRKMQQVKRAALAPSSPSGQDRSVAAQAAQTEADARIEKMQQSQEEVKEEKEDDKDNPAQSYPQTQVNPYEQAFHQPIEKGVALDLTA